MSPALILGTVQLGLPYGIANSSGKPDQRTANALVRAAWERGVTTFDTAQGYGDSERVLGQALRACGADAEARVITKLAPDIPPAASGIESSLHFSRQRLGIPRFYCVMLHREEQLSLLDAHVGAVLRQQRASGRITHIGVSVYSPEKALEALRHPLVNIVQIPASLFDRRFEDAGVFAVARERGKSLHIRSIFLQGLLLMQARELPPSLAPLRDALTAFQEACAAADIAPALAALHWMRQRHPEASLLFGAETVEQVRQNLETPLWTKRLAPGFVTLLDAIVPPQKRELLNPALWKR